MRNTVLGKIPRRQAGALQQRSSLWHPHHRRQPLLVQAPNHAERRAVSTRRQRTRVADRADPSVGSKQRCTMPSDLLTTENLGHVERLRRVRDRTACHRWRRPLLCRRCKSRLDTDGEIDRSRARGSKCRCLRQHRAPKLLWLVWCLARSERNTQCARNAKRRRPTHRELLDRDHELGHCGADPLDPFTGQSRLIQNHYRLLFEANNVGWRDHSAPRIQVPSVQLSR